MIENSSKSYRKVIKMIKKWNWAKSEQKIWKQRIWNERKVNEMTKTLRYWKSKKKLATNEQKLAEKESDQKFKVKYNIQICTIQ